MATNDEGENPADLTETQVRSCALGMAIEFAKSRSDTASGPNETVKAAEKFLAFLKGDKAAE